MKVWEKMFPLRTMVALGVPNLSFAAAPPTDLKNPLNYSSFPAFISALLDLIITIGIPIIVIFIVYSGLLFVTARGDTEQLSRARRAIVWTVIGAAIVLGAKVLQVGIQNTVTSI